MKALFSTGVIAFLLLVQAPFVLSSSHNLCENVSKSYLSDCKTVLNLDIGDEDKIYLINEIDFRYHASNFEEYPGLFVDVSPGTLESVDYNQKENLERSLSFLGKMIAFFSANCFFYHTFRKYFGGALWNVV